MTNKVDPDELRAEIEFRLVMAGFAENHILKIATNSMVDLFTKHSEQVELEALTWADGLTNDTALRENIKDRLANLTPPKE